MKTRAILGGMVLCVLVTAYPALAQHRGGGRALALEALSARFEDGQIAIDYRWSPGTLRDRRMQAFLNAQLRGAQGPIGNEGLKWDVSRGNGTLFFPLPAGVEVTAVDVWATGTRGRGNIETLSLNGIEVTMAMLRLEGRPVLAAADSMAPVQPWQPSGGYGGSNPATIEACGNAFEGQANEMECMRVVSAARYDMVPMIQACEQAMEGDDNELECVRAAVNAGFDARAGLVACEQAMEGDDTELACFRAVTQARFNPASMVKACEDAMEGDGAELECIRVASGARYDPTANIAACEKGMSGDDAELECVRRSVGR